VTAVATKQLVSFSVRLRDGSCVDDHVDMVRRMRQLAEQIDGFVEWRDASDATTYWGFVVFESEQAAQLWKRDPMHGAIHQQGEDGVYDEFHTEVFQLVRENHWYRDRTSTAAVESVASG
jgi:heme-degrading monooxygenase HmoA